MKLKFKAWLESNQIRNTIIDLLGFDSDRPQDAISAKLKQLNLSKIKNRGFLSVLPPDKKQQVEDMLQNPGDSDVGDLIDLINNDPLASGNWVPRELPPHNDVPPPSAPYQQGGGIGVGR